MSLASSRPAKKPKPEAKKRWSENQARAKRNAAMERYVAFLFSLFDKGFSIHCDLHCVQHSGPDQFYAVVRLSDSQITHERLEALLALVNKHGGKLHFRDGQPEIYLGRD